MLQNACILCVSVRQSSKYQQLTRDNCLQSQILTSKLMRRDPQVCPGSVASLNFWQESSDSTEEREKNLHKLTINILIIRCIMYVHNTQYTCTSNYCNRQPCSIPPPPSPPPITVIGYFIYSCSCTSQGSVAAMTFKIGSLRMEWRYWLAVSFMNWSINIVDRVLARNNVDVFTARVREIHVVT